ncbi:hypothetical protein [Helicobacter cetorum]|uniref:Uncharacterized protein n=1 Tax=Helicobacter cetorum (strain ATCC BAA-429 / MIT 00-7128) TaxID=182217 RepID=I0ELN8_HELC0|nr:hypothetical protein [Helicobacter cetorum]AFI03857.1 hypothetical protein HCW_02880 [Helicobacter cetorum MIT 00-7128]
MSSIEEVANHYGMNLSFYAYNQTLGDWVSVLESAIKTHNKIAFDPSIFVPSDNGLSSPNANAFPSFTQNFNPIASSVGSLLNGVVGIISNSIQNNKQLEIQRIEQETQGLLKSASSLRDKRIETEQKRALSIHLSIFAPYSRMANGRLYNELAPGKNTYDALNAYQPMNAMLGNFQNNPLNELIFNTNSKYLSGNSEFNLTPLYLAKFKKPPKDYYETLKRQRDFKAIRDYAVEKAYYLHNAMNRGFFADKDNYEMQWLYPSDFMKGKKDTHANKVYIYERFKDTLNGWENSVISQARAKILKNSGENNINSEVFLEENQFYSKGERLPLFKGLRDL